MKRASPWHRAHAVSAKTIYTWIWRNQEEGGCLFLHLRRRGKRARWFGIAKTEKVCIPHRKDISERPKIVDRWKRCGDWESDLVVSRRSGSGAVATFVERFSKYLHAALVADRGAPEFLQAARHAFSGVPAPLRLTLTHDNGSEICCHEQLTQDLKIRVYCARPFHSWERGLNEHTNGLLRDFFPKGTDFGTVDREELDRAVELINNRPRRSLHFRTPKEVLDAEIKRYAFETSE
jgi:IS30 family transposase